MLRLRTRSILLKFFIPQINTRIDDVRFILNQIEKINNGNIETNFANALDIENIGVFGHSFGGGTSLASSILDSRIKSCISLDGWYVPVHPDIYNKGLTIPFMHLGQVEWDTPVNYQILDEILPEAFAVVKETARRFYENESVKVSASEFDKEIGSKKSYVTIDGDSAIWKNSWDAAGKNVLWDMIHYDVQLIGGIVLHQGKIGEMQTGEGKTLVAAFPIFLNALTGRGVHLVTVNDYLAKRDSAWMSPIFEFHGLSVDCIDYHKPNSAEKKKSIQRRYYIWNK